VSYQVLIAAVAAVAAVLPGPAGAGPASAQSGQGPDLAGEKNPAAKKKAITAIAHTLLKIAYC